MTATGTQVAQVLRERRRELGLTRTRLAERSGVAASDIARWERGDGVPPPAELSLLAEAVGLDSDEARAWLDSTVTIDITEPEVAIELVPGVVRPANPFAERIELIRSSRTLADRLVERINGFRSDGPSATSSSRLRALSGGTPSRPAPPEHTGLIPPPRRQGPTPRVPDAGVASVAPPPAVMPVPVPRPAPDPHAEERFYRARRVATTVVLAALAAALWWSFGALGHGVGDLFDLFRDPVQTTVPPLP